MTPQQSATLLAAILVDAALTAWVQERRDDLIAAYYNEPASPEYTVWRTSISKDEVYGNGFAWAQIDNVTDPRWRIWTELFDNDQRAINPSKPNVRAGVGEVWTGTAAKVAVGDYVLGKCKRLANRVERLFAAGTGSAASPGVLDFEGSLTTNDISAILNAQGG